MAIKYDKFRNEELAKIHIGKKDLNLADDIYRDILFQAGRVESSKDLDWQGRQRVIDRFKELGWKPQSAKKAKATRRPAADPQSRMIRGLWIELHKAGKVKDPTEAALNKFVKKMTKVDDLGWLNNRQITVVKKALEDWLARAPSLDKGKEGL